MWFRLAQFWLQMYTPTITTLQWKEKDETDNSAVTKRLWCYEGIVHDPTEAKISAVETHLVEHALKMEDRIEEAHQKFRKETKEDLLQVSSQIPYYQGQMTPAREMGYTPRADLWFFL